MRDFERESYGYKRDRLVEQYLAAVERFYEALGPRVAPHVKRYVRVMVRVAELRERVARRLGRR